MNVLRRFARDDAGQTLTEYALLIAFIAIGAVTGLVALSSRTNAYLSKPTGYLS